MSTDRVQACLELLLVLSGGAMPDLNRLVGLTPQERREAESLYLATLDARRSHDAAVLDALTTLLAAEEGPDGSR